MQETAGAWGVSLCHYLVGTNRSTWSILTWHLLWKKLFVGTGYLECFDWVFFWIGWAWFFKPDASAVAEGLM